MTLALLNVSSRSKSWRMPSKRDKFILKLLQLLRNARTLPNRYILHRVHGAQPSDLITQIYFEGDVDIPSDPWASSASAINRIIPVNSGIAGDWFGTFDIVLSGTGPVGINELQIEYGDLSQNYPNPFNRSTRIFLVLNKNAQTLIEIYDQKGSLIKVLMNQDLAKGRYELNWTDASLSNGIYTTVWTCDNKLVKTIKMIHQTN